MAGDWIQLDTNLRETTEVLQIQQLTQWHASAIVGCLALLWSWVDGHADPYVGETGILPGVGMRELVSHCGGDEVFWTAVSMAGWLKVEPEGIVIPDFDKRFSASAKTRRNDALRKRQERSQAKETVDNKPHPRKRSRGKRETKDPPKAETPSSTKPRRSSVFDRLAADFYRDRQAALDWWSVACLDDKKIGENTEWYQVRILACCHRIAESQTQKDKAKIKNPIAYFTSVVGKKRWTMLEPEDIRSGKLMLDYLIGVAQRRQRAKTDAVSRSREEPTGHRQPSLREQKEKLLTFKSTRTA